ncbi:MAG: amidohydrolase [Sedimenticola sp.]|uniref:Omega-amidase YafV n=1 Tax=Sedimenticola thiotaurini TaxID=1543721 RepID=A0A558CSW4_9GAMM|nr:amidohydrolase [Sedimenticola sp.]MCW8950464.1 amidohydrolase [Sedimenticola sp.]TVT51836.1 MAG: amidohydrolase [Sedimenticola thiotaurini]
MQDLIVSFIQEQIAWHDPAVNRQRFESLIAKAAESDLILLPEMFSTGFSLDSSRHAESMSGESVQWMTRMARESGAVVAGSLMIEAEERYFNRLIWMRPDGSFAYYDKRHLFRMADEHHHYTAGDERLVVTLNGWRICPLICYDLRFPVWSRNNSNYDLLLYVANWPERRRLHWQSLLKARAIENLSYVMGVNRVGVDGNEITYSGDSVVISPEGEALLSAKCETGVFTQRLNHQALVNYRERFPAHLDADHFSL